MRKKLLTKLILVGFILLMTLGSVNLQEHEFISRKIELIGPGIDTILPIDINGDGIKELVIQQGKELLIYQPATRTISASLEPISRFTFPDDIFMWQITNLIGEAPMELVGLTPEGISFFPYIGSGFINQNARQDILEVPTIFKDTLGSAPLAQKFLFDLNGDKLLDLIIPARDKFILVLQKEPGKFEILQEISIKTMNKIRMANTIFEPNKSEIAFPLIYQAEINGDKKTDLIIFREGFAYIYLFNESGKYIPGSYPVLESTPGQHELFLGLSKPHRKKDSDFSYKLPPLVADINGDGLTDIVISDTSEDATAIYLNKTTRVAPFTPRKPDLIKRVNGWLINHELIDLNQDNLLDLIILQMKKVNILSGLQLLLAHKVDWELDIYLAQKGQDQEIYAKSPDYKRTITVPFSFSINPSLLRFQTPLFLSLDGDFNGDGLKDLLLREKTDEPVEIFYGNNRVFNKTTGNSLKLYADSSYLPETIPYGCPVIADLNNDGRDDIIIYQSGTDGSGQQQHLVEIFIR